MKTLTVGVLVLLAGCAKVPDPTPEPAQQPSGDAKAKPPAPAKEVPPALAGIFKERNALHKRQTGALLTITAKWEETPMSGPSLSVFWSIDYDGPRRPFTILNPGKNASAEGRTTVSLWYLGRDGKPARLDFPRNGSSWPPFSKTKDWFSVAADGKPVGGEMILGNGPHLKRRFGYEPSPGSPPLWVQLEHSPTDRGDPYESSLPVETWTLDAWTGQLWSPVVEVAVK